jgi:FAD/FMN-containing dehydrogenase
MNTKLLRRLRKEAKENIYLYPFKFKDGNVTEIIIVDKKYHSLNLTRYYGKVANYGDSYGVNFTYETKRVSSPDELYQGYTFEEALEELKRLRREYILFQVAFMKSERTEEKVNKRVERAQKLLRKY